MATQSTSGKISDLYELKEELGKYACHPWIAVICVVLSE